MMMGVLILFDGCYCWIYNFVYLVDEFCYDYIEVCCFEILCVVIGDFFVEIKIENIMLWCMQV